MSQRNVHEFFTLYQKYRFEDQLAFYKGRHKEFEKAHTQATWVSIILLGLTVLVESLGASTSPGMFKLICQLAATILPVFSTLIVAYNSLYGFEQQAKLYEDSVENLTDAQDNLAPSSLATLDEGQFSSSVEKYVKDVEKVFHAERGQWGQLAKKLKPQE